MALPDGSWLLLGQVIIKAVEVSRIFCARDSGFAGGIIVRRLTGI